MKYDIIICLSVCSRDAVPNYQIAEPSFHLLRNNLIGGKFVQKKNNFLSFIFIN